jgi:hypothetical protein
MKTKCEHHHTPCPTRYNAWHAWAEKMHKTHRQVTCPLCGLYEIWLTFQKADAEEARRLNAAKEMDKRCRQTRKDAK